MRQVSVMQQRHEMVLAVRQRGISVSGAAALFGVSRQTVHKWLARYDAEGVEGLGDRSSRPLVPSGQVDGGLEQRVVQLRTANPRWGPKRIHAELVRRGWIRRPGRPSGGSLPATD
ncbi:Mobile element protein [Euzebya pacifica]|uniref:Mobile element protein n=2 Tax=Euzebya pacifica TaxID=1608957 RepID=A0A346Y209_9ACTN|nr:Mobile element protein [Euzebya pacifica]